MRVDWLSTTLVAGLEVWRILGFFAAILIGLIAGRIVRLCLDRAADRRGRHQGRGIVPVLMRAVGRAAVPVLFAFGLRVGFELLATSETVASVLGVVVRVVNAAAFGYAVYALVDVIDAYFEGLAERTESKVDDMLTPLVGKSIRITILVVVVLQVIQSVSDKPITSILAGLGVGGLAVALAGQDTIKNFFGSLVIVADKPFEIGDRIVVDGHDGPVEAVGFRSTKVRTLEGHLVTVPNSEMVNKTIKNIGKRPHIRRLANITITYDTPPEKVQRALAIVKETLDNHEGMDPEFPPRVFFSDFNDCSLNIMMLYWYHPPDYWAYMDFCEKVNMQILERFNEEGIEFAFPTQTVYLANDDRRQLALRMLDAAPGRDAGNHVARPAR